MRFVDRRDAGRRLAARLMPLAHEHPVIVALPRGGVPVGFEVARALDAPLEVLAVRKLGAPNNPELAVGAVAEDGTGVLDRRSIARLGISPEMLEATLDEESRELRRRVARYRAGRAPVALESRLVIVVDDGLATGLTNLASVRALRKRKVRRIVVAVPVGTSDSIAMLGEEADDVICVQVPDVLLSVGSWYRDFAPVSDEQVLELLASASDGAFAPAEG
jgi:putative phosphoribosyl transferase